MGWTFFFLMVVLKIPIVALLYIVWWAIHAEPEPALPVNGSGDGGSERLHPRPPRPPRPRRGPHAEPDPAPPRRVRAASARSRQIDT